MTVLDNQDPTFTVPPSDTVCRAIDCSYNIDPAITGKVTDESDNCATEIVATHTENFSNLVSCELAGYVIRTWRLEDGNGNDTEQDQIIWVEPVPVVIPVVTDTIICDSSFTEIELTSPNIFTADAVNFDYTVVATGGITGYATPVTGLPVDHIINDQLFNPTLDTQSITYTITPVSPGGCGIGEQKSVTITINPTPRLTVDIAEQTYCDSSEAVFTLTDGVLSSTGPRVYSVFRDYSTDSVKIEGEIPGLDDNQPYGVSLTDQIRNLTNQTQTVRYNFRALIKDPRGDGSLAECNEGVDTTIILTINPTPRLSIDLPETTYCDSSDVVFDVIDGLINSTGAKAYYLTRAYDDSQVMIEGESPGTENGQVYGQFTDQVRNLTLEEQTITYTFKPVILDPRGDGSIPECNEGGDTTITITVNPTPRLSVTLDQNIYCDSSTVAFAVTDGLVSSTGSRVYSVVREYDESDIRIEGEVPGLDDNQPYGVNLTDEIRNLTSQVQTVRYTFKALIKDPRGDGSLVECNEGGDTSFILTINPTPQLSVQLDELIYCDSSDVNINVTDELIGATNTTAYHLTREFDNNKVIIEGQSPGKLDNLGYGPFTDEVRNLTNEVQTIAYTFKPVIVDPVGDGSILECNEGGDTTIIISINPTPDLRVSITEDVYCDSSTVQFDVADELVSSTGIRVFSVNRQYNPLTVEVEGKLPGLDDSQSFGQLEDQIRNLTLQEQTISYTFKALIKDPREDGSLMECNEGGDTTITLTINPTPRLTVDIAEQTYCDSSEAVFTVTDGLVSSTGPRVYSVFRDYSTDSVKIEGEIPGLDDNQPYGVSLTDQIRNLTNQTQTVRYNFRALIKDPRGDGSLAECNEGVDTTIILTINPTPRLSIDLPETTYCDSSDVVFDVIDGLINSTGAKAYYLTRAYDDSQVMIEGESPGTENGQVYGQFTDQVRNLTLEEQTITYTFKPVILDPRGDGSIPECNEGGDTTITITVNPTPRLSVTLDQNIYCDSSTVAFAVTDGLVSSTGSRVYSVVREYDESDIRIEGEVPGLDDNQPYGVNLTDEIRNLTSQVQTVRYTFKALIKDPRGDGSLVECNEGGDTSFVVYVNPSPTLSVEIPEEVYCDSSTINILVSNGLLTVQGAAVYQITRNYNPDSLVVEGQVPGFVDNRPFGLLQEEVRNLTNQVQSISYTFKPVIKDPRGDGSIPECDQGSDTTITLKINPTPKLAVSIPEAIFCDSSEVVFDVQDLLVNSEGERVYHLNRTYDTDSLEIVGENSGLDPADLSYGAILSDEVRNLTTNLQTVVYTFRPLIKNPRGDDPMFYCDQGRDTSITVYIHPTPDILVDVLSDTVCDEDGIVLNVTNPNGSLLGNWKYKLEIDYGDSISGILALEDVYDETDFLIRDTLKNLGNFWHVVSYTFTPWIESTWGGDSCINGQDTTILIYVNPTPAIRVFTEDSVICNGESTAIEVYNPNKFVFGDWEYDLIIDADPEINGVRDTIISGIADELIPVSIYNTDSVVHKVEYTFLPLKTIEDSLICAGGTDTTIVIWVNPTPEIRVNADDLFLCDGDTVNFDVRNPNDVRGFWNYDLIMSYDESIGGIPSDSVTGDLAFDGRVMIDYILTNSDTVAHEVEFRFVPRIEPDDGGEDCRLGVESTFLVTVYPTPEIRVSVNPDTIRCNDQFVSFNVRNPNNDLKGGEWYYQLEVTDVSGFIEGENADSIFLPGGDFSFDDQLLNTDTAVHEVIYKFIPVVNPEDGEGACGNGRDTAITVWVNPTPRIFISYEDSILCNNEVLEFQVTDGLGQVFGSKNYQITALYDPTRLQIISRGSNEKDTLSVGEFVQDSMINLDNEAVKVVYQFKPLILDTRPGGSVNCKTEPPIEIEIWINPTPLLSVSIEDTIVCDSAWINIEVTDELDFVKNAEKIYRLYLEYDDGSVSGLISDTIEYGAGADISDYLENSSNVVQLVSYRFVARLKDTRPGKEGEYCDNGTDTTITIYLNPTPKLDYLLNEDDTLCHAEGFNLVTNSLVTATHPLYYDLGVINNDGMGGVIFPPDSLAADDPLDQAGLFNPGDSIGTVIYTISPFISTKGCPGKDTTVTIKINPEPKMQITDEIPWAVCYDQGFVIPMSTPTKGTTGDLRYNLFTDGFNPGNVDNVQGPGDYLIENVDQTDVINNGDSIEEVAYFFTPVIRNARASGSCVGTPLDSILVEVAPVLLGNLVADTVEFGGWEIRCNGELSEPVHSNVRGGYYLNSYTFDWGSIGGANLSPADSVQVSLDTGFYWFTVEDTIGCFYLSDTVQIEEPLAIEVDTTIVIATCAAENRQDGEIDISPSGGTTEYNYYWVGPFGYTRTTEDVNNAVSGTWYLTMNDANGCPYFEDYYVGYATDIVITASSRSYGNFEIKCNSDSSGFIEVGNISGGFPGYDLKIFDWQTMDTIDVGAVPLQGVQYQIDIGNLPAGEYDLYAFDAEECYNGRPYTIILEEPDPLAITWENPRAVGGVVDISCYGEDDGNIDLSVSGGHTYFPVDYLWTGPDPDLKPTQDDQMDSSLGPGTYQVTVTDSFECQQTAEFTLIEPSEVQLIFDSISTYNGWNISCYGLNDGFIDISSNGGIYPHNYAWTAEEMTLADTTLQDQYNLVAGTYTLRIVDSINCSRDTSVTLIEPNPLSVADEIPRPFTGLFEIACAGDSSGQIFLTPYGGADSTRNEYLWTTQDGYVEYDTAMDQSALPEGSYSVLVTDINGCEFDTSYQLFDPDPILIDELSSDSAYCADTNSGSIDLEASGGVGGFTYLWSNGSTEEDPEELYAGVYSVAITDDNMCQVIDSVEVFESDQFSVELFVTSDYNGVPISCADSSDGFITLVAEGGREPYYYEWNNGATTENLEEIPEGYYKVIITDFYGCIDSAEVEIAEPERLEYDLQYDDPLCYNDSTGRIELLISGGTVNTIDDYQVWVNGLLEQPSIRNLPQGTYAVRVEDLNDCFAETVTELVHPDSLELSFDTEPAFCKDKSDGELRLSVNGGIYPYLISWDQGLPANEDYFDNIFWGQYVATVTDANNCVTIDSVMVDYTYTSCLVIPNAFSPNGDGFNDLWIIEGLELYQKAEIRIFDRWGTRVHYSGNAANDPWDGYFDGRELPIDSYHYIIDLKNDEPPVTGNVTIVR